jgi:hypothetical protein
MDRSIVWHFGQVGGCEADASDAQEHPHCPIAVPNLGADDTRIWKDGQALAAFQSLCY